MKSLTTAVQIEKRIYVIREHKVMFDFDLAKLYGTTTGRLNEQVKRNRKRFPSDFVFQLTVEEKGQVIANCENLEHLKYAPVPPFVFTEHGALMAANILNSAQAVRMSVFVVRAFVKLREILASNVGLAKKVSNLERKYGTHDDQIREIFSALRELMDPPTKPSRQIGFNKE
jgi:ORF6N domain